RLVETPRIEASSASTVRDFSLSGYSINGQMMDMSRIDEVITLGDTEIWTVSNTDGQTHNFHVHGVQFQILDIDGREPPPHLQGWKDTVWLPPSQSVRLIMTFTDYTSDEWPLMYHCHILRHEGQGMMGQFLVVEPGQSTDPSSYQLNTQPGHHPHSG
ncbi:MAG: multicopper oxidase domain-containing protein, partial [Salinibacterium sp.]|nr:multicopper oxidase domain-containing protein [Salinibacterium sp.]